MAASVGRWAAVPVSMQMDPRVMGLSPEAELLLYRTWLYVGEHTTDGDIPGSALPLLTMKMTNSSNDLLDELRQGRLVIDGKGSLKGHDVLDGYLDVNPTAAQIKSRSDHGRKGAIARWAKGKPPPDSPPSPGDDAVGSGTGNASGNAPGIDGHSDGDADGNAPHGTGRNGTYETTGDIESRVGLSAFSLDIEKAGSASDSLEAEPELSQDEIDRIHRRKIELEAHFGKPPF